MLTMVKNHKDRLPLNIFRRDDFIYKILCDCSLLSIEILSQEHKRVTVHLWTKLFLLPLELMFSLM